MSLARIFHEFLSRDHEDGRTAWQPQGVGSEAYLHGTSQEPTPEDARLPARRAYSSERRTAISVVRLRRIHEISGLQVKGIDSYLLEAESPIIRFLAHLLNYPWHRGCLVNDTTQRHHSFYDIPYNK